MPAQQSASPTPPPLPELVGSDRFLQLPHSKALHTGEQAHADGCTDRTGIDRPSLPTTRQLGTDQNQCSENMICGKQKAANVVCVLQCEVAGMHAGRQADLVLASVAASDVGDIEETPCVAGDAASCKAISQNQASCAGRGAATLMLATVHGERQLPKGITGPPQVVRGT